MAKFRATKLILSKKRLTKSQLFKCAAAVNEASLPNLPTVDVSNPTVPTTPLELERKVIEAIEERKLIKPPEAVGDEESGGQNGRGKKHKWKR